MVEPDAPEPSRYDEVRRKLVERGYLQGRIERFLLKDLLRAASPASQLFGAALKAALLGGPILGGLLAAGAVFANHPMLGGADALLLWIYFGLLAGAVLLVLDVLAAALVGAMARRRGVRATDSLRAAFLVGIPTLAYVLVLWWERKRGGSLAVDLGFLAAAVAATLLVAWLAGVVSLAGIVGRTGEVPVRSRRGLLVLAVVLAACAAGFLWLPEASARDARPEPAAEFTPRDRPGSLLFLGIDGLDGALVEALAGRGAVDGLLSAMARGAVYPMHRDAGLEPPEVWTTILTGVPAEEHGVRTVGAERLPGVATPLRGRSGPVPLEAALRFLLPTRTVPTSGAGRRVRTLWEIAALEMPSACVGWWASWPAGGDGGAVRGYVVSDRVLPKLLSGGAEDRDTAPESLYPRLRLDFDADRREIRSEFDGLFPARLAEPTRAVVWESFLIDAYAWRVGGRLAGDPAVRASFVYLPGLDILRHRLGERQDGGDAARLLETQEVLEGYVRWLDARVASAVDPSAGRRVVIVADPGRTALAGSEGFVVVAGPGAVPGCVGPVSSLLDVAPLVLREMGFPVSLEMPGRLPPACLAPVDVPDPVATFGRRGVTRADSRSDYDPEMVERLKSLGYLR